MSSGDTVSHQDNEDSVEASEASFDSMDKSAEDIPVDSPIATFVQRSPCVHGVRHWCMVPIYRPSATRPQGFDVADDLPKSYYTQYSRAPY